MGMKAEGHEIAAKERPGSLALLREVADEAGALLPRETCEGLRANAHFS
jgi:hypothetical protein